MRNSRRTHNTLGEMDGTEEIIPHIHQGVPVLAQG